MTDHGAAVPRDPVPRVAVIGAGQLAQMMQQAAVSLDVELRVLAAREDDSAVRAGAAYHLGDPSDLDALRELARGCDVVTADHEQIPTEHLRTLAEEGVVVAPGAEAAIFGQDKLHARRELGAAGFPVPPFALARSAEDVEAFAGRHGWPLIAKAPRGGYDGRGVWELPDAATALPLLEHYPDGLLLEPLLPLRRELSAVVARSATGEVASYPVVETLQRDGICHEVVAPAPVDDALTAAARSLAEKVVTHIGAVGVVAVELFQVDQPLDDATSKPGLESGLILNELALRPHNSAHLTIEGATTSQFEQHLRAVLGWPLGSTTLTAPAIGMANLLGPADGSDPRTRLPHALGVPGAHVHLYGKTARPGRKLGHVTACAETREQALDVARAAVDRLVGAA